MLKEMVKVEVKTGGGQFQFSGSQSSEVLQSEAGTLNSSEETNGSSPNICGSEVTSMYSRGGLNSFAFNHLGSAVHSLADMIDGGSGIIMPNKWVETAATLNLCLGKSSWVWYNDVLNPVLHLSYCTGLRRIIIHPDTEGKLCVKIE